MKNVKFRGKQTNSAAKFRGSIPRQKPKFRGSARNSAVRGKLWALTITSDAPVHNLGVTFDPHLSFSNHIPNLSCFMHIRDLRRIRPMLDSKTASTIATSIVHSKIDYCNFLFLNLESTQIQRLQLIQNSFARAVTRTPRHLHITQDCP